MKDATQDVSTGLVDHSAPDHRCQECYLRSVIRDLTASRDLARRSCAEAADLLSKLRLELLREREARQIAERRVARLMAERDACDWQVAL